jgi:phosphopantetheinyl transferase
VALKQAFDVDIWTASPDDFNDAQLSVCSAMLDGTERAKASQFRQPADRRAYVLAHALRRVALAQALQVAPAALVFACEVDGKPVLTVPRDPEIYFSLSHSRALVACAVTPMGPIGIDVSSTQDGVADLDLLAGLVDLPDARQREAELGADPAEQFFFYWTALEAFWKATGCGLSSANPPIRCQKNQHGRFEIFLPASALCPQAQAIALSAPAGCWVTLVRAYTSNRTIEINANVQYNLLKIPLPPGEGLSYELNPFPDQTRTRRRSDDSADVRLAKPTKCTEDLESNKKVVALRESKHGQ